MHYKVDCCGVRDCIVLDEIRGIEIDDCYIHCKGCSVVGYGDNLVVGCGGNSVVGSGDNLTVDLAVLVDAHFQSQFPGRVVVEGLCYDSLAVMEQRGCYLRDYNVFDTAVILREVEYWEVLDYAHFQIQYLAGYSDYSERVGNVRIQYFLPLVVDNYVWYDDYFLGSCAHLDDLHSRNLFYIHRNIIALIRIYNIKSY